jgi:phosphatidylglycerophosphate synthase
MVDRFGPHAANALTALRMLLTPVFVVLVAAAPTQRAWGVLAVVVFTLAAASDVADGRLARRFGSAGSTGRIFDHLADITFILVALTTYVAMGIAPWWVPAAIAAAFASYAINSWVLRTPPNSTPLPVARYVGHVGGVCNYVLIGILVCNNSAGVLLFSARELGWFFVTVPIYSGLAIVATAASRMQPAFTSDLESRSESRP